MVSADRSVVVGEQGPFYYMLESFSKHWERVDVIGTRPERVELQQVFGNVHLHHPMTGKLRQAAFITRTGLRLAAERPYTVITSHDYNPFYNGLGAWRISRRTGIPYVAEIHHVPGYPRAANLRERIDRRMTRLYARWAMKRAAGFRVVNDRELPDLLKGWGVPRDRIHVLSSLYLDEELFCPDESVERDCDILFVGRLVPNKGVLTLLEAVARLRTVDDVALRVRLLGRGPEAARIDAFVKQHDLTALVERVDWVPDAEALADLYRRARVLVCASFSEGGPRVVPEALACGTPVISTGVGLVPDLIHDGQDGLLFDGSTADLLRALRTFFGDPVIESRMRAALPPTDSGRFQREAVIERLASGLKEIAAGARPLTRH
jgi:glycosyltransferase involved in cell wall biosynthesis